MYENGCSGFLGKHSCMDGTPTLWINEFILTSIMSNKVPLAPSSIYINITTLPPVSELQFTLKNPIKSLICTSEKWFDDLVGAHNLHVLHYEGFRKNLLKKHKFSPQHQCPTHQTTSLPQKVWVSPGDCESTSVWFFAPEMGNCGLPYIDRWWAYFPT